MLMSPETHNMRSVAACRKTSNNRHSQAVSGSASRHSGFHESCSMNSSTVAVLTKPVVCAHNLVGSFGALGCVITILFPINHRLRKMSTRRTFRLAELLSPIDKTRYPDKCSTCIDICFGLGRKSNHVSRLAEHFMRCVQGSEITPSFANRIGVLAFWL